MTKKEAMDFLVERIVEIERERLAENFSIDATKQKKEPVEKILKALKEVELDNENK